MRFNPQRASVLLASILVTIPVPTSAEPITLPSFTAVMSTPGVLGRANEVFLRLTGPGVFFSGEIDRSFGSAFALRPCGSCAPGTVADFSAAHRFSFDLGPSGFITVGGDRFEVRFVETDLTITSRGVTIPPPISGVSEVITPIAVSGALMFQTFTARTFTAQIYASGEGHARIAADSALPGGFSAAVTLSFGAEAAPIPEPSTILLLSAAGFAGLTQRKRLRAN